MVMMFAATTSLLWRSKRETASEPFGIGQPGQLSLRKVIRVVK